MYICQISEFGKITSLKDFSFSIQGFVPLKMLQKKTFSIEGLNRPIFESLAGHKTQRC